MKKQGFIKGSLILLSSVVITKALGLVYRVLLTRSVGGTGMGYYARAFSVFTPVMAVAAAGIPSSVARIAAEEYALERYANVRKVKRTAMMLFAFMGIALTLVMLSLALPVTQLITGSRAGGFALAALIPSLFFCSAMSVLRGYYEGLHNMYPTAVSEIIETVLRLAFGLGLSFAAQKLSIEAFARNGSFMGIACSDTQQAAQLSAAFAAAGAVAGTTLSSAAACVCIFLYSRFKGDGITKSMLYSDRVTDPSGSIVRRLVGYSFPVGISALISTLTGMIDMLTIAPCVEKAYNADNSKFLFLTGTGITPQQLPNFVYGSYTALALALAGLAPTLTAMLGKSSLAAVSETAAKGDKTMLGKNINRMLSLCAYIVIPCGALLGIFGKQILQMLFSARTSEISAAAPSMAYLGAAVIFMGISLPCFTTLHALKRSAAVTAIMLAGGAIKLIGNILLISRPALALSGAAVSMLISEAVVCVMCLAAVFKSAQVRPAVKNILLKPLYAGVMASLTAVVSMEIMEKMLPMPINTHFVAIVSMLFSVIMYLIVVAILCEMPKSSILLRIYKKN